MSEEPNKTTPERFQELKAQLNGKLTVEEAGATLDRLGDDRATPPILRARIAMAILELKTGRSVQSTMARLRRATGLDPEK